jgi:excisionase family DNA binding protein
MKDRLLSVDDVCEYLGISRDTAYKWIETRGLPAYRLGRLWKFKREEVDNWVEKSRRVSTGNDEIKELRD